MSILTGCPAPHSAGNAGPQRCSGGHALLCAAERPHPAQPPQRPLQRHAEGASSCRPPAAALSCQTGSPLEVLESIHVPCCSGFLHALIRIYHQCYTVLLGWVFPKGPMGSLGRSILDSLNDPVRPFGKTRSGDLNPLKGLAGNGHTRVHPYKPARCSAANPVCCAVANIDSQNLEHLTQNRLAVVLQRRDSRLLDSPICAAVPTVKGCRCCRPVNGSVPDVVRIVDLSEDRRY